MLCHDARSKSRDFFRGSSLNIHKRISRYHWRRDHKPLCIWAKRDPWLFSYIVDNVTLIYPDEWGNVLWWRWLGWEWMWRGHRWKITQWRWRIRASRQSFKKVIHPILWHFLLQNDETLQRWPRERHDPVREINNEKPNKKNNMTQEAGQKVDTMPWLLNAYRFRPNETSQLKVSNCASRKHYFLTTLAFRFCRTDNQTHFSI